MLKQKRINQTTDEKGRTELSGNFINNNQASKAMNNAAGVPRLVIDDSVESRKVKTQLAKSRRYVVVEKIDSKEEKEAFQPPSLYTSDGMFKGYLAIQLYLASNLWLANKP